MEQKAYQRASFSFQAWKNTFFRAHGDSHTLGSYWKRHACFMSPSRALAPPASSVTPLEDECKGQSGRPRRLDSLHI
jgi:hypothetical protein